jgi:glycosyltransferase involved in cell wall biosynthesis
MVEDAATSPAVQARPPAREGAAGAMNADAQGPGAAGAARSAGTARARIALAHDWLCGVRGGEHVLDRLARLVLRDHAPGALYTMFDEGRPLSQAIDCFRRVAPGATRPKVVQRLRKKLLPTFPALVGALSRTLARDHAREPIDLLISTSSSAIKGLRTPARAGGERTPARARGAAAPARAGAGRVPHVCVCFTPARYVWSRLDDYAQASGVSGLALRATAPWYRRWDRATSANVTHFISISRYIAREVERCYGRRSLVVFPPVRTAYFTPDAGTPREDFWLCVGALEPYKRVDLAVRAANIARARLIIVGGGSGERVLREMAGPTIEFAGRVGDDRLRDLYRRARLFLFPQVEDFGIVAGEALACGTPVVARLAGAAPEIVPPECGAFFSDARPEAVLEAVARCPQPDELVSGVQGAGGVSDACVRAAARFSEDVFDAAMSRVVERVLAGATEDELLSG